jgi:hypothetical protein
LIEPDVAISFIDTHTPFCCSQISPTGHNHSMHFKWLFRSLLRHRSDCEFSPRSNSSWQSSLRTFITNDDLSLSKWWTLSSY